MPGRLQRRQRRNPPPTPGTGSIAISFRNLTSSSVTVDFAPDDKTETYYFALIEKEAYLSYESDDQLIRAAVAYIQSLAEQNGRDVQELLAEELLKGNISWPFSGLTPQTDYIAYAFGLTAECQVTSALSKAEFTTLSSQSVQCTFELSVTDVTATSFTLNVTPSDEQVPYYFDLMSAEQYAMYCNASPEGVPSFLTDLYLPSLADEYGLTIPEVVSDIVSRGPDSFAFSGLEAATAYYAFAIGVGVDGSTTTAAAVERFETSGKSENTFEVEIAGRGADWAKIRVRPLNNEPYILVPELQEYFEGMTDDEIIVDVLRAYAKVLSDKIYYGGVEVTELGLIPDRDYYALVFGYDNGAPTTPLTRLPFRTNKSVPVNCSFEIAVKEVGKTSARVAVTPSDDAVSYFSYYISAADYETGGGDDAALRAYTDTVIDELVRRNEGWPRWEVLQAVLSRGSERWTLDEGSLVPGTDYYAYAIGMTADGTFTTQAALSDRFTTLGEHETLAEIEIDYHLMDGANFGQPDNALIYGWFYPKHAEVWYGAGFVDDDSVLAWSDDEAAAYLLENGQTGVGSSGSIWNYVPWGGHINYIGMAVDADGNRSPVGRLSVTADRSSLASVCGHAAPSLTAVCPAVPAIPDLGPFPFLLRAEGQRSETFRSMRGLTVRAAAGTPQFHSHPRH